VSSRSSISSNLSGNKLVSLVGIPRIPRFRSLISFSSSVFGLPPVASSMPGSYASYLSNNSLIFSLDNPRLNNS
jgi:hypothetical protein